MTLKATIIGSMGLLGSLAHAGADLLVEGRVRLESGEPAVGAQVLLFDLADLRAPPVAATTDGSGHFTLPVASLGGVLPDRFELGANYPNPFNPSTMIPYQLPTSMYVRLEVYNLLGQRVATLVDGDQPAGLHTTSWDATDAAGQAVGAGVYLYRLSGDGVQATRSMLLIDGQAGMPSGGGGPTGLEGEAVEEGPVYGLTVSGPGLVPYVDPAFRVEGAMGPLDLIVETPRRVPPAKAASSGGILGDVDNTGDVGFFDALLVALYSQDASIVMPNNGDVSLGDVNADGRVDLADAWLIAAYLNDPSDPSLPAGIGEPLGPAAALSPDPSTVTFAADGAWHRFTVQAGEPLSVVVNPEGTTPRLEITTSSGRSNFCPAEVGDDVSRQDGQTLYLAGCATGPATVELRRRSDGTVLNTYTFEVTGSPADLVVQSASVSDSTLTPGQSFTLRATVRNQGTGQSAATTLHYYRSTNRTISTQDTQVGSDAVGALAASGTSAESIRLSAPSSEGTYYYGACAVSVSESDTRNNCSAGVRVTVEASHPDLIVEPASVSESGLTPGQSFTLSATVRNQGTGESAATTLRWYRSTNATISTGDTEVGTGAVATLSAGATSAESIPLTAPSSEGTYYYGACVASVAGESNTGNNCSSAATVTVTVDDGDDSGGDGEAAMTASDFECEGTPTATGVAVTITGKLHANRDVTDVRGWLTIDGQAISGGIPVPPDPIRGGYLWGGRSLGDFSAGQTKSFSITEGFVGGVSGVCGFTWTWED
ncbi:MAG: T9SS type A sorting domain-containing protein [Gemmatimonadaceae bacterium]|nr:T9SS type A sorting domain-containing protein [Gemmatimonadaceae bacterium]